MCYRPLHINNNTSYFVDGLSVSGYDVPCGKCLDCLNNKKQEWQTRIAFELSSLYRRGGRAVFLTFTYNDACLPIYRDKKYVVDGKSFEVPCFNHKDVLTFLNRLKVEAYKRFGANSYKYFMCSEYGKNTKRPHYHAIFFLQPFVNWSLFVKICRSKWSYGFMFPKFDKKRGVFVDSNGLSLGFDKPCISALGGCSKYVSKYITKDMSYYGRKDIQLYLSDKSNKLRMSKYLPKHWQSNNLGISVIDSVNLLDDKSVKEALSNGVVNPLTFKIVPFPKYAIDKLMYKNVISPRVSEKTNKPLYDRILTDFGRIYMYSVFTSRLHKYCYKMSDVFQNFNTRREALDRLHELRLSDSEKWFGLPSHSITLESLGLLDVTNPSTFVPYALYKMFWRYAPPHLPLRLFHASGGDISKIFDIDMTFSFWLDNKDNEYLKHRYYFSNSAVSKDADMFRDFFVKYEYVVSLFESISKKNSELRAVENERKFQIQQDLKQKYKNRYDKSLC